MPHRRLTAAIAGLILLAIPGDSHAQFATVGVGTLISDRPAEAVAELHAETPPFFDSRAYVTLSWTNDSEAPTVITAVERQMITTDQFLTNMGVGLLWLEFNDYRPFPMLLSSTVVRTPIPRTSFIAIASTQPFQDFEWSLVLKVGVTVWFVR